MAVDQELTDVELGTLNVMNRRSEASHDIMTSVSLPCLDPSIRPKTATLSWQNLTVTVTDAKGNKKRILNDVAGFVEPRHMLAIMGPSGCGKSTLLDALAGRLPKSAALDGDVRLNGHITKISYGKAAYVTQEDVLLGALTVRETLLSSAMLRLPKTMSRADKIDIVDNVLKELGLSAAANTLVGNYIVRGVSGGQRRRVSIGCELVTSPALIFLDEPTSGLDAAAAYHCMRVVQRLTEGCRTVVSVIHQPSSEVFELFDQLCLLSAGSLVFFGAAHNASGLFEAAGLPCPVHRNEADHFLHSINKDFEEGEEVDRRVTALMSAYAASKDASDMRAKVQQLQQEPGPPFEGQASHPPAWQQTWTLTVRTLLDSTRNISVFWMRLGMYIMLCLALGLIFLNLDMGWQDVYSRASLLFFVVAFLTFMSIAGYVSFTERVKVFVRERLNGYYGVATFVVSDTLATAPFIFLIALVSTIVMYFWTNLNTEFVRIVYFVLNLFLSLMVVESIMMAIAPIVPHYLVGIAAGAGLMGLYMLCCGFFIPKDSMTQPVFVWPIYYMAYHTYSFHGLMMNEFYDTYGWGCPCSVQPQGCPAPCALTGEQAIATWDIAGYSQWIDLAVLGGMVCIYRLLFYVTLKIKEWRSR